MPLVINTHFQLRKLLNLSKGIKITNNKQHTNATSTMTVIWQSSTIIFLKETIVL